MQRLSKRLQAAADFVSMGSRAADIGTDHGFLPIYLIQSGKCPQVIAMDIRKGPLERAREHIAAAGLGDLIETRLSDGMQALEQKEADSAVITGMGGLTVLHILKEAGEIVPDLKELVLEPQSDIAKVRRYLREHKMVIDQEELVQEAGKFYPVLHVAIAKTDVQRLAGYEEWNNRHPIYEDLCNQLEDEERVQGVLDQYGACVIYGKHPLLYQMLERDEKRELGILQALGRRMDTAGGNQERADATGMRRQEVERRLEEIRALLKILRDRF